MPRPPMADRSLEAILADAAAEAAIAPETGPAGDRSWAAGETVFATLDETGAVAAFRLDPVLAAAARRTPDTLASERGGEWVVFAPGVIDGHAADRAAAWFAAAARRATGG